MLAKVTLLIAVVLSFLAADVWFHPVQRADAVGTIIQVNSTADDETDNGNCTLREAIKSSNTDSMVDGCGELANMGIDSIRFAISGGGANPVIDLLSELPPITDQVTISGNTGGATRVVLVADFPVGGPAFYITANNVTIRFFVIQFFTTGVINSDTASGTTLLGNYIGTTADGMGAAGNYNTGVLIRGPNAKIGGTTGTTPGGACTGDCNLISGDGIGISFETTAGNPTLYGNFIGTNVLGTGALGNTTYGIEFSHVNQATIGSSIPAARNVISGNGGAGIEAVRTGALIEGNFIGTDTTGLVAVPNGDSGITLDSGDSNKIQSNVISGNGNSGMTVLAEDHDQIGGNFIGTGIDGITPIPNTGSPGRGIWLGQGPANTYTTSTLVGNSDPNVIAFNSGDGVYVDGLSGSANTISANSIHDNGGLGINLDNGANNGIEPPLITNVTASSVTGNSLCNDCIIEVFSDDTNEGKTLEGSTFTNGSGQWTVNAAVGGPNVTATKTSSSGNTSEFSPPFAFSPATPTPSPSPTPTASPSSTATPTATSTVTPTGSPVTATATPTPTSTGVQITWGDNNCSGGPPDVEDALLTLAYIAILPTDTGDCPDMGASVDVHNASIHEWGDVDCSNVINATDALKLLKYIADFGGTQPGSCPDIGEQRRIEPA